MPRKRSYRNWILKHTWYTWNTHDPPKYRVQWLFTPTMYRRLPHNISWIGTKNQTNIRNCISARTPQWKVMNEHGSLHCKWHFHGLQTYGFYRHGWPHCRLNLFWCFDFSILFVPLQLVLRFFFSFSILSEFSLTTGLFITASVPGGTKISQNITTGFFFLFSVSFLTVKISDGWIS